MSYTVILGSNLSDSVLSAEPRHAGGPWHVGRAESERLMGAGRESGRGPLPAFLQVASEARRAGAPVGTILIGHSAEAPVAAPLQPMLAGAALVAAAPGELPWEPVIRAIREVTSTDPLSGEGLDDVRFVLVGCHTEGGVLAAAHFLRSILGYRLVATSPHLVGSAASEAHLAVLRHHLPRAGVQVLLALHEAVTFAGLSGSEVPALGGTACRIDPEPFRESLAPASRRIVELLCLHWTRAQLRPLGGGFSGSLLVLASGWKGQSQTEPMVLKVDNLRQMRRELDGYHQVKDLLGKHVPTFDLPVAMEDSLGVGMELAAMEGAPACLQDSFEETEDDEQLERFRRRLDKTLALLSTRLYRNTLRRDWVSPYRAFHLHIDMQQQWLRENLEAIAAHWTSDTGRALPVDGDLLSTLLRLVARNEDGIETEVCLVHGDLNLKNIICDSGDNVWLIDWTHCARMPVELDFAKMENDVKFVISKQFGLEDLPRLRQFEDYLVAQRMPASPEDLPGGLRFAKWDLRFRKVLITVRRIREACFTLKRDEHWLVYRAALLKYALHSLSFDQRSGRGECDLPQLMFALHSVETLLNDLVVDDFHLRIRGERPPSYPPRQRVSIDSAPWSVDCPEYDPPYFVAPDVLANDRTRVPGAWADPEDVGMLASELEACGARLDHHGRPLHPHGRTGIAGRGALGRWGPNVVVVAIVTRVAPGLDGGLEVLLGSTEGSDFLQLPQDFVRAGEDGADAFARVLDQAAGWRVPTPSAALREGYDYDARRTDHAWVVTSVRHLHLAVATSPDFFRAGPSFESVSWHPLESITVNRMPAAAARQVRHAITTLAAGGQLAEDDAGRLLAATG